MLQKRPIVLLGATGSIGTSTLEVLRNHPDKLSLIGIAADSNYKKLAAIAYEFEVPHACLSNRHAFDEAKNSNLFPRTELHFGKEGLDFLVSQEEVHSVLMAIVGTAGLQTALTTIKKGKVLALASKEILVMAGAFFMKKVAEYKATVIPVDSEHSALFQCLEGHDKNAVHKLVLTASGGAFRNLNIEQMSRVTPKDALKHPTWAMGPKVTLDSATLANKGLELIEARWLFDIPREKLQVVIHPTSIIHSLVQFNDGTTLAKMSPPSMTLPIQYALLHPMRFPSPNPHLDLTQQLSLELYPPDLERFPCLRLAFETLSSGNLAPTIFNAANEVAGRAFLNSQIPFLAIPEIIDNTLQKVSNNEEDSSLEVIIEKHNEALLTAEQLIKNYGHIQHAIL